MTQEEINKAAQEYKVNETKRALHLIREPDALEMNMKLFCAKDIEAAFKAGVKWADEHPIELENEEMGEKVKDKDLRGWISWSERKPEEGTIAIVIVCDIVGFRLVFMGEIDIKMIEAMWKNRTQDMYWIYLPKFKIGGK